MDFGSCSQLRCLRLRNNHLQLRTAPDCRSFDLYSYTNPTANEITIVLPESYAGEKVVYLLDGSGQVVLSKRFDDIADVLEIEHLPSGMYNLRITIDEKLIVEKVIMVKR